MHLLLYKLVESWFKETDWDFHLLMGKFCLQWGEIHYSLFKYPHTSLICHIILIPLAFLHHLEYKPALHKI